MMTMPDSPRPVFLFVETGLERGQRSVYEYVNDTQYAFTSITIAESNEVPHDYTEDEGIKRLRVLALADHELVGFDINAAAFALHKKYGIKFRTVFDVRTCLQHLGIKDNYPNACAFIGQDGVSPIDVARELYKRATNDRRFSYLEHFVATRTLDENVNGLNVDKEKAQALLKQLWNEHDLLVEQFAPYNIRVADVGNPEREMEFVNSEYGLDLTSMGALNLELAKARRRHPELDAFLNLRSGYDNIKREISAVKRMLGGPGRVYFPLKYGGTHTGRLAGGGKDAGYLNVQGLPAHTGGGRVRKLIIPDDNESWVACDLSAIEPRILAYLAGMSNLLKRFHDGEDVYIWFAKQAFPGKQIVKGGENDHLRQLAKQAIIGLGYGQSMRTFSANVLKAVPNADLDTVEQAYKTYSQTFPKLRQFRNRLYQDFISVFKHGVPRKFAGCTIKLLTDVETTGTSVEIVLPTGRSLFYRSIVKWKGYRGDRKVTEYRCADALDLTRKPSPKAPTQARSAIRETTLVNNVVQAIARDILFTHWHELEHRFPELRVRFSIHDELVISMKKCTCPGKDRPIEAGRTFRDNHIATCPWMNGRSKIEEVMSRVNAQALPNLKALPLRCEASSTIRDSWGK